MKVSTFSKNQGNLIIPPLMKKIFVLVALISISVSTFQCKRTNNTPPNIVLFFVDDLGWQDTSVPFWDTPTKWNERYRTPNMERLAAKGVKFTNAYATPVCSPTRVSLLTGMNAARHRVTNWTLRPDKQQPMEKNHPSLGFPEWNYNGIGLKPTTPNAAYATPLPQLLQQKGYHTIHAGKAHFGALGYPSSNPENLGFAINIAGHAAGAPSNYLGTENFGNGTPGQEVWAVPGLDAYHGKNIFLTEALTQEVLKALDVPVRKQQPFFLYFATYGVHTPLKPDDRFIEKYRDQGLEEPEARYASMIESMDHALGKVLDYLEAKALTKNTVILFMSDNGGLSAVARGGEKHRHNSPLASGKGSIYEGGIRVPMLAYWPGTTAAGTTATHPVIIEDFFISILEVAQIARPQHVQTVDGQSFVPALKGVAAPTRPLFWHYPNEWGPEGPGIGSFSAIRYEDWKLIYFHSQQQFELYNLSQDISEQYNLFFQQQERAKQLVTLLNTHLQQVRAQMPYYKKTQQQVPFPLLAFEQQWTKSKRKSSKGVAKAHW